VNKPGILTGALVGLLLTAVLIVFFVLGFQLFGLPFVPSDFFNFVRDLTPGPLLTAGIDFMVGTITALNLGRTDTAAKTAEIAIAILMLGGVGIVASAAFFAALRNREIERPYVSGLILGVLIGIPVAVISALVGITATTPPLLNLIWIVGAFLLWGAALDWAYGYLAEQAAAAGETAPTASAQAVSRRQFIIRVGGAAAAITVIGAGVASVLGRREETVSSIGPDGKATPLPQDYVINTVDGLQPAPGTRAEYTPVEDHYRIDITTIPPTLDEASWKLRFSGLVDNALELSLADIRNNYESMDQIITLACISNPVAGDLIGTTRWTGVSLQRLLADVGLREDATHLKITAADGFDEVVALDLINADERVMLAYAWDDQPLTVPHGFPLRIYIPNHYGMKQPKWIENIEVIGEWEEGYWVRRGWDRDALMRATSVIDTIAVDDLVEDGNNVYVPVGGIAHAGDRGIARVEVRVDDGEWQEAQLKTPLSETTWVIWRYDWPFEEGEHRFTVRCFEGNGTPQIDTVANVRPSGATGLHSQREIA
jgi:DMSO/TMAO reductase YedYZ molybdopterin-dependent catalytic subunit